MLVLVLRAKRTRFGHAQASFEDGGQTQLEVSDPSDSSFEHPVEEQLTSVDRESTCGIEDMSVAELLQMDALNVHIIFMARCKSKTVFQRLIVSIGLLKRTYSSEHWSCQLNQKVSETRRNLTNPKNQLKKVLWNVRTRTLVCARFMPTV